MSPPDKRTAVGRSVQHLARVALAWVAQRAMRRVRAITGIHETVALRSERWCRDGDSVLLEGAYCPERLNAQSIERVGPVVLVEEPWYDEPPMLYVLRADREVRGDVAASLRCEAAR